MLIAAGADVRCKDKFGMTAFDYFRQNVKLRTTAVYFYLKNAQQGNGAYAGKGGRAVVPR